jgi:hypothetical protein
MGLSNGGLGVSSIQPRNHVIKQRVTLKFLILHNVLEKLNELGRGLLARIMDDTIRGLKSHKF